MVSLRVMLIGKAKFGIGDAIWCGTDVGAHACRVGLERQDREIAHHLHVFASLVALRNADLDRGRLIRVTAGRTKS